MLSRRNVLRHWNSWRYVLNRSRLVLIWRLSFLLACFHLVSTFHVCTTLTLGSIKFRLDNDGMHIASIFNCLQVQIGLPSDCLNLQYVCLFIYKWEVRTNVALCVIRVSGGHVVYLVSGQMVKFTNWCLMHQLSIKVIWDNKSVI